MTDGHHGPFIGANSLSGYHLHGEHAPLVRLAIQKYAQQQGITNILDGGDQNTYERREENFEDYRLSTQRICKEFRDHGQYIVANGNHDFDGQNQNFRIQRQSELIKPEGFDDTSILVLQPKAANTADRSWYFYYDKAEFQDLLEQVETSNLILLSHWRLPLEGTQPTVPQRSSPNLQGIFDNSTIEPLLNLAQNKSRVLGVHGHSHYFKFDDAPFPMLTMPSFVQADHHERIPCGLFSVLNETNDGLSIDYKKVHFDPATFGIVNPPRYRIMDVSEDVMNRYKMRPYIKPDARTEEAQQLLADLRRQER